MSLYVHEQGLAQLVEEWIVNGRSRVRLTQRMYSVIFMYILVYFDILYILM